MCDFSLEVYGSRPAREGEKYVTSRFPSGAVGLAAFGETSVPVCVQCDTQLMLEAIPMDLQISLGVSSREAVTFVRLERGTFHDGVKFMNGKEITFPRLRPGGVAVVRTLLGYGARNLRTADGGQ